MKIGVIGAGNVGSTLGKVWDAAGHDIMFGRRDPRSAGSGELPGHVGTVAEAVQHGDVILFAVPGKVMTATVSGLDLAGKIVLDATNFGGSRDQPVVRAVAEAHPQAHVYKAFNTLGYENFENPLFGDGRADMLFIGPEAQRQTVAGLITDVGLNPVYVGGLEQSPVMDDALSLWFALSRRFGRHLAFRVLRDEQSA